MNQAVHSDALYRIFRDISTSVHSETSVKEILELLVRKTTEVLDARGTILRILNLKTRQLELGASYGLNPAYLSKGPVSSQKIITELCRQNKVIIIDDILSDPRVQYPHEAWQEGIRMIMDLPLTIQNHVVGIIRILFDRKKKFSQEELNVVVFIAEQSACAIDKARLVESQQTQYHQLALQTEKLSALGRMAAGIAHEINNPLTGILLYGSNLIKKAPPESALRDGLEIIIHETIRCRSIIQELLEFSRDREPSKTLLKINPIITKALTILENEFHLHHITIESRLAPDLPDTLLDPNQMEQVFVNLLLNAVEAIQAEGRITIRSALDENRKVARVEISDTGGGILPENIPKMFEPFFSTKPKGTGLGLAVSYGIVRNHQGQISVTSQPGKGSCFVIEIPVPPNVPHDDTVSQSDETG